VNPEGSHTATPGFDRRRLVAFGLSIECDWPLPGSTPAAAAGELPARRTSIRMLTPERVDAEWSKAAERIFEPDYPDGKHHFTIDRGSDYYQLWFEGFGRYLVALDGTVIGCDRAAVSRDRQERFLFAQALPLAAALQGFELLHASAVSGHDGVAAFVAASGSGKTTLASRLVLRGAGFVTDDVLALEPRADAPLAHPGPAFIAVPNEDQSLIHNGSGALGAAVGTSDKVHASPLRVERPLPLRALFYLEPGPAFQITPLDGGDVRRVLASAFAPYLVTSDRLFRHLEITQLVSARVSQFRLQMPRTRKFEAVIETLEAQLRELAL
jgi:hypothetical protein